MTTPNNKLTKPVQSTLLPCPNCRRMRKVFYTGKTFSSADKEWRWHYAQSQSHANICQCTFVHECSIPRGEDIRTTKAISWRKRG